MKVDGVVVAGGGASRMGGLEKPLMLLGGQPLIDHVADIVRPQVASLVLILGTAVPAGKSQRFAVAGAAHATRLRGREFTSHADAEPRN